MPVLFPYNTQDLKAFGFDPRDTAVSMMDYMDYGWVPHGVYTPYHHTADG